MMISGPYASIPEPAYTTRPVAAALTGSPGRPPITMPFERPGAKVFRTGPCSGHCSTTCCGPVDAVGAVGAVGAAGAAGETLTGGVTTLPKAIGGDTRSTWPGLTGEFTARPFHPAISCGLRPYADAMPPIVSP